MRSIIWDNLIPIIEKHKSLLQLSCEKPRFLSSTLRRMKAISRMIAHANPHSGKLSSTTFPQYICSKNFSIYPLKNFSRWLYLHDHNNSLFFPFFFSPLKPFANFRAVVPKRPKITQWVAYYDCFLSSCCKIKADYFKGKPLIITHSVRNV